MIKKLFLILVLLILGAGAGLAQATVTLKPQPPKYGAALCAQVQKVPTSIEFVNRGRASLQISWIDEEGRHRAYGTIRQGDTVRVETFLTCPWAVADCKGKTVGIYLPVKQPGKVILGSKRT